MDRVARSNEDEERNKIVSLQLITGGKEPPSTGEDWLSKLPEKALFFVQKKNSADFALGLFWKESHEGKVVKLRSPMLPEPLYVNPSRFANAYSLYEDCGIVQYNQEEGNSNDQRDPLEGADPVAGPSREQV